MSEPQLPSRIVVELNPIERARMMKVGELVQEYDPDQPDNPFGQRLAEIFGNDAFLVFDEDNGFLLVDQSVVTAEELREGYPPRKTIRVEGKTFTLYRVGHRPLRFANENPVRPGAMLRPDGVSDNNIRWTDVALNIRQLLWVAAKHTGEITVNGGGEDEIDIWDKVAKDEGDFSKVALRYQQAEVKLRELIQSDSPPSLRMKLQRRSCPSDRRDD
jgi:hypothetical protein